MSSTFDVHIWEIRAYKGTRKTTYTVRWKVGGREARKTFDTKALAESFRAELIRAQRQGSPFDIATGLPESQLREQRNRTTWYQHSLTFIDMKWPTLSGGSRRTVAESLATITCGLVDDPGGYPDSKQLFRALVHWAFNLPARTAGDPPEEYAAAIAWIERHSIRLNTLTEPKTARLAYNCTLKAADGTPLKQASAATKRRALSGAIGYAVELGLLESDPLQKIKIPKQRKADAVDRRVVVNPFQARLLLNGVAAQGEAGRRLVAFFATIYFAGLRPGEVIALRRDDLYLPDKGWGELRFFESSPYTGAAWTDSGEAQPRKALKHRAEQECRIVPAHPELVRHLRQHLETFGTTKDGRLFVNGKGNPLAYGSYSYIWERARKATLTESQAASPLAGRTYDLRHAAVSTWLNAGVPATQIAEWAGHSVEILLSTYAKCVDGQEEQARKRIEEALGTNDADTGDTDPSSP
ncbi:tyrosine-type recombinase/integrase [Catenulispora pinisilvae]|uniref:tyrosine-type recombinase/integrase n=1 Tax=Catenulispora pinisilvae TaxID=2705253 RepID=UPI001891B930|nr:tyrosine-type recombinase/integrase [Catenulispora pinisilvae]